MFSWHNKKVLVTGGRGFLGSHVVKFLKTRGVRRISAPTSEEFDLRSISNCRRVVKDIDIVFHLAAKVGGIGLNRERPGELFYDNIIMGTQLMEEARRANVKKFITLGTICSYPKFTSVPFTEDSIWDGYPEETNAPYGLAKKMLLVQSQAYRQQYSFNSIVVFPTNLYGPGDNFDPKSSHVIPALIHKIYCAKNKCSSTVTVWGTGSPTRDFLYIEDAARGIILAAEKYDSQLPINLGSGKEVSIKYLAECIAKLMNYKGSIKWDTTKPDGQPRRCVSNKRAEKELGFKSVVDLKEGLKRTIEYYEREMLPKIK